MSYEEYLKQFDETPSEKPSTKEEPAETESTSGSKEPPKENGKKPDSEGVGALPYSKDFAAFLAERGIK